MSDTSSFRRRLVHLRRRAHLTQEALAERADLSRNYIGLLESGQRQPSLRTVFQIQKALSVKLHELVDDIPAGMTLAEPCSVYGKDLSASGNAPPSPREYERLVRRLQKCAPEEIAMISRIVNQVLKFKCGTRKSPRSKRLA